jgi:predicted DNA-binding transcriptional regulator AlpA
VSLGILEDLTTRLRHIEETLASLVESVRVPTPEPDDWSEGAMTVREAVEFSGMSRAELYKLMAAGRLVYATPTAARLVSRRSLVRLLRESARVVA